MNFIFETLGSSNFLVYELQQDDQLDTMSLGMLTNNSIPGLAKAVFTQMDDKKYIKYDITSKLTAATVFSSPMSKKRLLTILGSMVSGLLRAEDYMLDTSAILLDSEHIFIDGGTGEAQLICLPVLQETKQPELGAFFKEVVFNWTKFEQTDDFGFMAALLNYFNSVPALSLVDFKALVDKLANGREEQPRSVPVDRKDYTADMNETVPPRSESVAPARPVPPTPPRNEKPSRREKPPVSNLQFGNNGPKYDTPNKPAPAPAPAQDEKKMTMWYLLNHFSKENLELYKAQKDAPSASGPAKAEKKKGNDASGGRGFSIPGDPPPQFETPADADMPEPIVPEVPRKPEAPKVREVVRFDGADEGSDQTVINAEVGPCLVRTKTGEVIELNKALFRIGRERRSVDYAITGNPSISKKHVEVRFQAGAFHVRDEDSLNHTFVNGKRIAKNTWVPIKTGDILKLSNEEFECKLN